MKTMACNNIIEYVVEIRLYFDNYDEFEIYESFCGFRSREEAEEWADSLKNECFEIYGVKDTIYSEVVLSEIDNMGVHLFSEHLFTIFTKDAEMIHSHRVKGIDYRPDVGLSDFACQVQECLLKMNNPLSHPRYLQRLKNLCQLVGLGYQTDMANDSIPKESTQRFYNKYLEIIENKQNKNLSMDEDPYVSNILQKLISTIKYKPNK